jgi:hypothetical protein
MARLDTGWHVNTKVLKVGLAGMGLHAWSISYCDHALSDGFVPNGAWPALAGVRAAVVALVRAGLWVPVEDGFRLHDYTEYNRTRAHVESVRAAMRANGRAGGLASAQAKAEQTAKQNPTPGPGPLRSVSEVGDSVKSSSRARARNGPSAPRALGEVTNEVPPERLPNGATQCPTCPEIFQGAYADHLSTSPRHRMPPKPRKAGPPQSRSKSDEAIPPEVRRELDAMERPSLDMSDLSPTLQAEHERLLASDRRGR